MRIEKPYIYFECIGNLLGIAMLFMAFTIVFPSNASAWPSVVTEENLREAVLEKSTAGFSSAELMLMDVNKDGVLDVSDLVFYLKTEEIIFSIAEFDQRRTTVNEGSGAVNVFINFSEQYTGPLKYSENGVVKEIAVNGTSAVITISNTDDSIRSSTAKLVNLEIVYDSTPGILYAPGGDSVHVITINENDTLWNGTIHNDIYADNSDELIDTSINIHFQMEIIINGSIINASLITDGNGIIPKNGASDFWPVTGAQFTGTQFTGTASGITASNNNLGVDFKRSFQMNATFTEPDSIQPGDREIIEGDVIERLTSTDKPFLNRETSGKFVLIKDNAA